MPNALFQQSVNITPSGMPQYLNGDMLGNRNLYNPSQSLIVNKNSSVPQGVASFTWYVDNQTCTPLRADSPSAILLGFVARTQDTTWLNANVQQGWSMQVAQGYQLQYFATGTFAAVCPSLNNAGAGPILYNDLVLINNTTGALASQTSSTIPSGYTQCITGNLVWRVIDVTPVNDAQGNLLSNLVAISNVQSTI
jgi:hypothetical protein